jgi:membrane peptidoglycan carboxypeptidase
VGFTNEVTIAVWVGYDNADGRRRTLGGGQTGASVAVPIFEPIVQAAWTYHSPRTVLAPPSAEARRDLVAVRSDGTDDEFAGGRGRAAASAGMTEYLRRDRSGRAPDSRYMLVSRGEGEGGIDGRGRDPFGRDRDPFGRDLPAREPETRPIWGSPWGTRDREPSGGGFFSFPQRTVEPRGRTRGPWD